jgi:DNA segregation ATPase FtsK/SpoIIIE, S-DNA-T family
MAKAPIESKIIQEIVAIIITGLGLLLLLALISFDPADLGLWVEPPNATTANLIGPVGAFLSGGLIFVFGTASFILPLMMVVGGVCLVFAPPSVNYLYKPIWFLLIIISACCLIQLAGFGGFEKAPYPGGMVGYYLNYYLSLGVGSAGSGIMMTVVYLVGMILFFEVRPIELGRKLILWLGDWYERRQQEKYESADPMERIELERKRVEKQARQLEKKIKKEKLPESVEPFPVGRRTGSLVSAEPAQTLQRPAPRVIDTTVLPPSVVEAESVVIPETSAQQMAEKTSSAPKSLKGAVAAKPKALVPDLSQLPSYENYKLPGNTLLLANDSDAKGTATKEELEQDRDLLVATIKQFGIEVTPGDITKGATITRYEVYPAVGVRVERIAALEKNIARALKAERVNILAPIPGRDTVGIEVPNSKKMKIVLRDLFESPQWKSSKARLPIAIGKDVYGAVLVADLAEMPHLLIAGTTGSGKSVCINCVLLSLLYRYSPDDLRIILVDPKVVELQVYNDLPHLVVPVVTDPKKVLVALRWVINEMEKRYRIMAAEGVRNIMAYNVRAADRQQKEKERLDLEAALEKEEADGENGGLNTDSLPGIETPLTELEMPDRLPYIVVIIDELADLMQTSPAEVELAIARLSAKARAAGIHLIIATQTPRAQVITGVIKTNVPSRIAFQVPSALDSRVILDENGAENLLGKGDLLYLPPGSSKLVRAQGAYVSEEEVTKVVDSIREQSKPAYEGEIHAKLNKPGGDQADEEELTEEQKELYRKCWEVVRQEKKASTSMFQRRLRIGYSTGARVIDFMEDCGIIGPKDGAKDREILVNVDQFNFEEMLDQ